MTAVPNWDTVETDAELVRGSLAGDRAAFAQIYDRYADRLYDFCVGMLRDFDGAADCVQDTFVLAATRLPQLREADKLRPWLYSIARNEALRRLRELRRETPSDDLPDVESDEAGPDTLAARTELADLLAEAAGGLTDRDRAVFDLAFRHGLSGPELADALGVSHTNANTMVQRLRQTVERTLGALLVCRRRDTSARCEELGQILAGWDGQFTVLMRKRVSRHIESCAVCDEERRRLVSPSALLAAAPAFISAPEWLRDKTIGNIQLVCHTTDMTSGGDADLSRTEGRRRLMLATALIIVLGAVTALMLAWLNRESASSLPTEIGEKSPTSQVTVPTTAPANQTVAPIPTSKPVAPVSPADTPTLIPPEPPLSPVPESSQPASPSQTRPTPVTRNPSSFAPAPKVVDPPAPTGGGNGSADGRSRSAPAAGSAP